MTNWRHHIKLKDLLDDDESDESAVRTGIAMAERLRALEPGILVNNGQLAYEFDRVTNLGQFNRAMDCLYDSADRYLVWID